MSRSRSPPRCRCCRRSCVRRPWNSSRRSGRGLPTQRCTPAMPGYLRPPATRPAPRSARPARRQVATGRRRSSRSRRDWVTGSVSVKTNAARILDALGIHYELREYEVDEEDLSAESVARKVGLPPEQVFKTQVARGDRNGVCFAVVPANAQLDLKTLAKLSGDRKTETVPLKEVQPLTGYIRGGVTALGAKKDYPVYADETIELFDVISISAGVRGTQVLIAPADYLRITNATVGEIARQKSHLHP